MINLNNLKKDRGTEITLDQLVECIEEYDGYIQFFMDDKYRITFKKGTKRFIKKDSSWCRMNIYATDECEEGEEIAALSLPVKGKFLIDVSNNGLLMIGIGKELINSELKSFDLSYQL